ncbi:phosphoglucomutase [Balneicella halophila]|uniref:Phosphoglucomutase n=1 Tax=Balneicella halophila TaxID=1537566 RepID=A0A7L4UPP8_BALHA|nr:phospho-sugar mutase [Balneicella halophila]PVX51014.1 phosphoglucomutase [Balneicella halophila]
MDKQIIAKATEKAKTWLEGSYDEETKAKVRELLEAEDKTELVDSFYKDLEFGTGGLRGIMGVGTNRMNIYTVGGATQGLANYLNKQFKGEEISMCIGYDCRHNNKLFSNTVANVMSANGIKAYIFEDLRPTPELSFAIRELGCKSGVIITASHNPKEYNGYKAYWDDGSQLVPPHDKGVIDEVKKIKVEDIKFDGNPELIEVLGKKMDEKYLAAVKSLSLDPEVIQKHKDLKIVFTPLHGATHYMTPASIKNYGFSHVYDVPEQYVISGDFPTVESANPEEPVALEMAIDRAKEVDADLVMACDPDGDRIGISIKNDKGEWILVNGNQTALLFTYYLITQYKKKGLMKGNEYIVKTVVTSELLRKIAEENNVKCYDTYTGFKWIAEAIRKHPEGHYIGGGEESFGYMVGNIVRDKDGVSACSIMAEIVAWAKEQGKTLYELLKEIYVEYGFSQEKMIYIVRKGISGAEEINQMMHDFRHNPPKTINGSEVMKINDYKVRESTDITTGKREKLNYETASNVLQYYLEDGSKISVRPSGTEPKIKFYFEVKDELKSAEQFDKVSAKALDKIAKIAEDMGVK